MVGIDPLTKRRRNGILIPRNTPLPVTAKRIFKTKSRPASDRSASKSSRAKAPRPTIARRSATARSASCRRICPPGTPVEVLFHYQPNGRLKVRVAIPGTDRQVATEIVRENSLCKEHMDRWRQRICGQPPTDYR